MKKAFIIIAAIFAVASVSAQNTNESVKMGWVVIGSIGNEEEVEVVYYTSEPEFPGGEDSLYSFLERNIHLPDGCYEPEGKVVVVFNVEKDGSVTNVMIKRDIGHGVGDEVKRVVKTMPKWKPATYKGEPVALQHILPVAFTLHQREVKQ
ncbi:MAG: energy transducer TonB [Bacteroidales bacterium]|nr:energy transducer TonB [Bacteroidales bacterium]